MAKKARATPTQGDDLPDEPILVICRGGDCGSKRKHPGFDHLGQLQRLKAALVPDTRVVPSACLDACDHSNVIVTIPGETARAAGEEPIWIGHAHDTEATEDVIEWVRRGDPSAASAPTLVRIQAFRPTRANRHELEEALALSDTSPQRGRRKWSG